MTIALNDRRARYVASAGQTSFDVDFPIDSDTDVAVYHKVDLTGVITLLTLTTDYTVTLDGAAPSTADVDLVTGAAVNDIITVEGETDPDRDTDFTTGGDFFAGTVNDAEDRQYRIDQETKRDRDRTAVANRVSPDTFDPTLPDVVDKASRFLRLNSAETALEFVELTTGTTILSDATPAASTASGAAGTSDESSRGDHAHPSPMMARGDIIVGDAAGPGDPQRLGLGAANTWLKSNGTDLFWQELILPSQAEAEAGIATIERVWTAKRVAQGAQIGSINARIHGADGVGTETTEIQAGIDAAVAAGKPLVLPDAVYTTGALNTVGAMLSSRTVFYNNARGLAETLDKADVDVATALIHQAGDFVYSFRNSNVSGTDIYVPIFPGVDHYDVVQGVCDIVTGGTIEHATGLAGYVKNLDATVNGVCLFGCGYVDVDGGAIWGINTLLQDDAVRGVGSDTGRFLINELDYNVMHPDTTVIGLSLGGNSLAQPTTAVAFICNPLGTNIEWGAAFQSQAGAAVNAFVADLTAPSGNNLDSQNIILVSTDGSGTRLQSEIRATAGGNLITKPASGKVNVMQTGAGTNAVVVDGVGIVTMPLQSAFLAFNSVGDPNVTGDGTLATVDFDTEVYDQNADFASDTFTAPVTGKYQLNTQVRFSGVTVGEDTVQLVIKTSNRDIEYVYVGGNGTTNCVSLSVVADMDAADTAIVRLLVSGESSDVVDIDGHATILKTTFSGCLQA